MRRKKISDCRSIPIVYTVPEAVTYMVTRDFGESPGQIEEMQSQLRELIEIVGKLVAGESAEDILSSFEPATEADIKAYEER